MKKIKCKCPISKAEHVGTLLWENDEKFAMVIGKFSIEMHFPKPKYTYTVLEDK